jgi:hypothetical protein
MGPAQRTILRVGVGLAVLAVLVWRFQQSGAFENANASIFGIALMAVGVLAAIFGIVFRKQNFALQERLTPVWGYAPPKWAQPLTWLLIVAVGAALVVKSLYF